MSGVKLEKRPLFVNLALASGRFYLRVWTLCILLGLLIGMGGPVGKSFYYSDARV